MLEHYYVRPLTVDRIRASWIAGAIEQYVGWLAERQYSNRSILRRIPVLVAFGEFAKTYGATQAAHLPDHVEAFVHAWVSQHTKPRNAARARKKIGECVRNPIRQMLCLVVPGYVGLGRPHKPENPFAEQAPRFFTFLAEEKGLRPRSILHYQHYLRQFAGQLQRIGLKDLSRLSPSVLSGFIAQYGPRVARSTLRNACGTLRVFLRYLHREGLLAKDLSAIVEFPQSYRLAGIPRSIPWEQVEQVLAGIDRRAAGGKRDFAMLLLLATYGLRACEVAALTLDDIDWRNERLKIRERKAGNSTTYPLSAVVGAAIIDYLKNGRPAIKDRHVFLRTCAPLVPIGSAAVTCRATHYIRQAGIRVPYAAAQLRAAPRQRQLLTQTHRRLRGPSRSLLDPDLRQGGDRATARSGARRWRGGAMKARSCFQSFLGPEIERFLAHKRALGRRYDIEEKTLVLFDDYLVTHRVADLGALTPTFIDQFLLSRPRLRPRSYNHLRCTIGRLFVYLVGHGRLAQTPVQSPPRRSRYQRTPFIFDVAAARRLLAVAQALPDQGGTVGRGKTYYVLFAILYGLGLRVSESCRLRVEDLDFKRRLLIIRETKFYKSRLVPFGPKLAALLEDYLHQKKTRCEGGLRPAEALFSFRHGDPVNPCTVSQTFHSLIPRLHLDIPPGVSSPRLHDLRHAFAVNTLTRWYREGVDPQSRLLTLATFLGHVDVNSTAVYLTTTPTLLEEANRRFATFAAATLTEGLKL